MIVNCTRKASKTDMYPSRTSVTTRIRQLLAEQMMMNAENPDVWLDKATKAMNELFLDELSYGMGKRR